MKRHGIVVVGMETSGVMRRAFQALGHETYSIDRLPSQDDGEEMAYSADGLPLGRHMTGDIFEMLENMRATDMWPAAAVLHPDCTNLTNSASWAFADPDYTRWPGVGYHQKVKPETLVGRARRDARREAVAHVNRLAALPIDIKVIENPVGHLSSAWCRPSDIVQPYHFGDDASKATCLWFINRDAQVLDWQLPRDPAKLVPARNVGGRLRWANQTDAGQNRISPGADRWQKRADTYPGIAAAVAQSVSNFIGRN